MWKLGSSTMVLQGGANGRSGATPSKGSPAKVGSKVNSPLAALMQTQQAEIQQAALSGALNDKLSDILKHEDEMKQERAGGRREIDMPVIYDANAPRGGPPRSRVQYMVDEKDKQQQESEGGLADSTDPKLLIGEILKLREESQAWQHHSQAIEAENEHLKALLRLSERQAQLTGVQPSGSGLSASYQLELLNIQREREASDRLYQERLAALNGASARLSPYARTGMTPEQERYQQAQALGGLGPYGVTGSPNSGAGLFSQYGGSQRPLFGGPRHGSPFAQ